MICITLVHKIFQYKVENAWSNAWKHVIYYKDRWRFNLTAESIIEIVMINVKVRMNLKKSVKILLKYFDTFQLLFPSSLHLKLNFETDAQWFETEKWRCSFAMSCLLANAVLQVLASDCSADDFLLMLNINTDGSNVFPHSGFVNVISLKLKVLLQYIFKVYWKVQYLKLCGRKSPWSFEGNPESCIQCKASKKKDTSVIHHLWLGK